MPTWAREIMAIISKSQRAGVDKVVIQSVLQITGLLNGRTADSGNIWQGHDSPTSVVCLTKYVMHVFRAVGSLPEGPDAWKRKERTNKKECDVIQRRGWNGRNM
jgi:hypothetical protein